MTNVVTVRIRGMRCGMCEAHICDTIRKEYPDAKAVKASHTKGQASFRIGRAIDEDRLKSAIDETGYTFESIDTAPYERKGFFHRR